MIPNPRKLSIDYYDRHLEHRICRPILAEEFKEYDPKAGMSTLELLVRKLALFCKEKDGYAIAAPQVGLYLRLTVIVKQSEILTLANPEITYLGGSDVYQEEACLSLPPNTAAAKVTRNSVVRVNYQDVHGVRKDQQFIGLMARIVQHEIDHLDGCFFINRVGPVARDIVLRKYRKYMKEQLCSRPLRSIS